VLREAQEKGYAERNPEADVEGYDACRKIAILAIDPHLPTMEMRRKGYADALADAQLGLDPALYAEIPHVADYREHVVRALDRIFESTPDVDGFFFTTHILATEALRYFHDHGIDSDRLGLACMHEDPLFRVLAPRMNIARYPAEAIGRHAVRMILDRIARKAEAAAPEAKVLACELDFQSA
ncbi:MAG: substrate-binding domain-containing protein, partial [Alistipes sp.]|nr:substrate-binding domain-containing protein [Alistipes sp.]